MYALLILVVDADPEVHRVTRSILEEAGYTCQTADTAIDALLRWEFLPKPVTRETLLPAIERLLSGTEATSSDRQLVCSNLRRR